MWNKKTDAVFFGVGKMLFKCRFTVLAVVYFLLENLIQNQFDIIFDWITDNCDTSL